MWHQIRTAGTFVSGMNRFDQKLAEHKLTLRRSRLQTLQINVGRKCNQACRHCHVDAAPWRTEMIDEATAHRIGAWMKQHRPEIVDITGGAPELSEFFRYFVETARESGAKVIDRNNLTIIEEKEFGWLPEYLAKRFEIPVELFDPFRQVQVDVARPDVPPAAQVELSHGGQG